MALINSVVSLLTNKRLKQIDFFRNNPIEVQTKMFRMLIERAADTEWGKQFDYKSIKTTKQFQERVPVQDYDSLKDKIERIRQGEKNILWPGEIRWFAKSSGTTSDKSKFIPVSKEGMANCHFQGGRDVITVYYANHPDARILNGMVLALGGSNEVNQYKNSSYFGDLSAVLMQNLPFWIQRKRTPSLEVALMSEWEEKLEKIAQETIKQDVTNLLGVPSWMLVLMKRVLEITGKNSLLDVWPNLELFAHGGVSFVPYRTQFERIIPLETMRYMESYNASEGFFAMQDDPSTRDMLLMLDYGVFYEFIPMSEFENENPRTLTLEDVEIGKNYAILITTNGGLWRYMIGDTIRFTSKTPYKIVISGRTRHYINAFGEEIIIDNAQNALDAACVATAADVREFTAAPIFMSEDNTQGGHEWIVEFIRQPNDFELFIDTLDKKLQAVNSDYEAKRYKNITLNRPIVHNAREGLFYEWLKAKGKLGGQNKVPRLANDRKYIDELLKIM